MAIAVMQPYIFPYIGYFQLVKAVGKFVFYDDVNYIKGGWINRNRILINKGAQYLTIPCIGASPNKLIKDIDVNVNSREYSKLLPTIAMAYKKAPFFQDVFPLLEEILTIKGENPVSIAVLAEKSVTQISQFLSISCEFFRSSESFNESKGLERAERLVSICVKAQDSCYINPVGGMELYSKDYFREKGIELKFIKPRIKEYSQYNIEFIPALSIIDVLMFNSTDSINDLLESYDLV